jgi:hypothetical protein
MAEPVTLTLSRDEAVVLFEWLHRFNSEEEHRFEDQAEQRVLWNLEASLESTLVEPFKPEYSEILATARSRLRDPIE